MGSTTSERRVKNAGQRKLMSAEEQALRKQCRGQSRWDYQYKQQPAKWLFFLFKSSAYMSSDVVFSKTGIWGNFTNRFRQVCNKIKLLIFLYSY